MSNDTQVNRRKQSIIAGGMISSAGIFLAKFMGLFYAVPFNKILESGSNVAIYGVAFNIYSYVLNICIAGFPFAIATMIAKYSSRNDYKTALLVKRLATKFMIGFGFVAMVFMIVFATPFASMLLPEGATAAETAANYEAMRNVLIIISFALFLVPILSSTRGFYQGLKHMETYALSQVLEQLVRIIFLLVGSAIAVYVFNMDRVWAVYFGAFSTSVAAIFAIIHLKLYDRKQMKIIKQMAKEQEVVANDDKMVILKELVFIAFPYLIVSILGYSDTIINTFFVKSGLETFYINNGGGEIIDGVARITAASSAEITTIIGAINYGVLKLMSIPMILAPGFSTAIIPHITSALEFKNYKLVRKNMRDCVDIVLYIGLPLSFCLFVFAKPLYGILFYPGSDAALELSVEVLRWYSIEAFLSTIGPIFTALMMAVGLRTLNVRILMSTIILKLIITYPMILWFGYPGLVVSSIISMGIFIGFDGFVMSKRYRVNWVHTFRKLLIILLGLVAIFVVGTLCNMVGITGYGHGGLINILQLGISGTLAMLAYFGLTYYFGIPQSLFHFSFAKLLKKVKKS